MKIKNLTDSATGLLWSTPGGWRPLLVHGRLIANPESALRTFLQAQTLEVTMSRVQPWIRAQAFLSPNTAPAQAAAIKPSEDLWVCLSEWINTGAKPTSPGAASLNQTQALNLLKECWTEAQKLHQRPQLYPADMVRAALRCQLRANPLNPHFLSDAQVPPLPDAQIDELLQECLSNVADTLRVTLGQDLKLPQLSAVARWLSLEWQSTPLMARAPARLIALDGRKAEPQRGPIAFTREDPPLQVSGDLPPALGTVSRTAPPHTLATGETGSGKTVSVILPQLQASIRYRLADGTQGAMLVIDPKSELGNAAQRYLQARDEPHRLFWIGVPGCRLRLIPGNTRLSVRDRVRRIAQSVDQSAGEKGDQSLSWVIKARALFEDLALLHSHYYTLCGRDLWLDWCEARGPEPPT